jgi:hypothetical protein
MEKQKQEEIREWAWRLESVIEQGNTENLEEFLKDYRDIAVLEGLMHTAAEHNNIEALKIVLKAGVSPDCLFNNDTPLEVAVTYGAVETAEFLLDAGADIHYIFNGSGKSASYLTMAAMEGNLPMVKMLLKRGADLHVEYSLDGDSTRYNALKWAVLEGHHEVAKYLRSQGAVWIEDSIGEPQTPEESMLQFLSKQFKSKPLPLGLSEIVCVSVPLSVHVFPPKRTRKTTIFVTSGLSEYSLIVPQDKLKYKFAEYILELPGNWEVTSKALEEECNRLPIAWIKAIGRYPHENQTHYDNETKITTEQIPELKTHDGNDIVAEIKYDPNLDFIVLQDGRTIVFYRISLPNNPEINKNESKNKTKNKKLK